MKTNCFFNQLKVPAKLGLFATLYLNSIRVQRTPLFSFLLVLLSLFLFGCGIEEITPKKITTRLGCQYGTFSVSNGRLVFDDFEQFSLTLEFLECATASAIDDWRGEFNVKTPVKGMMEFIGATADSTVTISDGSYATLKSEHDDVLTFSTDGSGTEYFEYKYSVYPEFFNANGEFQIDTTIFKLVGDKLVSITKPSLINLSQIDENVETDSVQGIVVVDVDGDYRGGCCPADNLETNVYQSNNRRLREFYRVYNATICFSNPFDQHGFICSPAIGLDSYGKHQWRRGFIAYWWTGIRTNLDYDMEIVIDHNFGLFQIPNPLTFTTSMSGFTHTHTFNTGRAGGFIEVRPLGIPILDFCIDEVNQTTQRFNPNANVSINCF